MILSLQGSSVSISGQTTLPVKYTLPGALHEVTPGWQEVRTQSGDQVITPGQYAGASIGVVGYDLSDVVIPFNPVAHGVRPQNAEISIVEPSSTVSATIGYEAKTYYLHNSFESADVSLANIIAWINSTTTPPTEIISLSQKRTSDEAIDVSAELSVGPNNVGELYTDITSIDPSLSNFGLYETEATAIVSIARYSDDCYSDISRGIFGLATPFYYY